MTPQKNRLNLIPEEQKRFYLISGLITVVLFIFSIYTLKLDFSRVCSNFTQALNFVLRMLTMDFSEWRDVLFAALQSISVGILATILSSVAAFFVSFMAASNVSVVFLTWFCKGLTAIIRAVPTLIWTLVFVAFLGLGPFPGVLGLCFHSFAYLVKAYAQSIEEVKPGSIEALKATGATWLQCMARGVFPSITTALISWTALRLEINIAESAILGFVGAGGIGHELVIAMRMYAFEKAGFVVLVIFLMSFLVEMSFHRFKISIDKQNPTGKSISQ